MVVERLNSAAIRERARGNWSLRQIRPCNDCQRSFPRKRESSDFEVLKSQSALATRACVADQLSLERTVRLHALRPWTCSRKPFRASLVKADNSDSCTETTVMPCRAASAGTIA